MASIDFVTLAHDVKECCRLATGLCTNCPYEYIHVAVCGLRAIDNSDLKSLARVYNRRIKNEQSGR